MFYAKTTRCCSGRFCTQLLINFQYETYQVESSYRYTTPRIEQIIRNTAITTHATVTFGKDTTDNDVDTDLTGPSTESTSEAETLPKKVHKKAWSEKEKQVLHVTFGQHFLLKLKPSRCEIKIVVTYNIINNKHHIPTRMRGKIKNMVKRGQISLAPRLQENDGNIRYVNRAPPRRLLLMHPECSAIITPRSGLSNPYWNRSGQRATRNAGPPPRPRQMTTAEPMLISKQNKHRIVHVVTCLDHEIASKSRDRRSVMCTDKRCVHDPTYFQILAVKNSLELRGMVNVPVLLKHCDPNTMRLFSVHNDEPEYGTVKEHTSTFSVPRVYEKTILPSHFYVNFRDEKTKRHDVSPVFPKLSTDLPRRLISGSGKMRVGCDTCLGLLELLSNFKTGKPFPTHSFKKIEFRKEMF
ncbi:hypothetical protein J6590_100766 [Homalodisca vitripennis]|nr:hypothetical protein J6590_100766 [Homalodisca vitripennis]